MSCPLPTGGVGGARDDDAPFLRDPPQRTGGQQVILSAHLKGVLGRKRWKTEKRPKKKGDLLQGGFGLGPPVEVVDIVVAQLGAIRQDVDALHAEGFVGQALFSPPQFCGKWGENTRILTKTWKNYFSLASSSLGFASFYAVAWSLVL